MLRLADELTTLPSLSLAQIPISFMFFCPELQAVITSTWAEWTDCKRDYCLPIRNKDEFSMPHIFSQARSVIPLFFTLNDAYHPWTLFPVDLLTGEERQVTPNV